MYLTKVRFLKHCLSTNRNFWVSSYDSECIEWKGRAFNLTTEKGIFVGGEVGFAVAFFVGACMKHMQQLNIYFLCRNEVLIIQFCCLRSEDDRDFETSAEIIAFCKKIKTKRMRKNRTTEEDAIIMSTRVLNPQMLSLLIGKGVINLVYMLCRSYFLSVRSTQFLFKLNVLFIKKYINLLGPKTLRFWKIYIAWAAKLFAGNFTHDINN